MRTFAGLVCGILLVLSSGSGEAAQYLVVPSGAGDFPTIQAAIDAASDGDVILLGYGRFVGIGNRSLRYNGKAITIRSLSGHPETCIIDCEGSTTNYVRAIMFNGEGPGAVLQGVTIERGYMDNGGDFGGGIYFYNASPTLIHVVIRNCGAFAGGGFAGENSSPHFTNCRIEDSGGCGGGGGWIYNGSPVFTNCVFANNYGVQGAGGLALNNCTGTVTDCLFADNSQSVGWGGAMGFWGGSAVITRCTFWNNTTFGGSGPRCVPPPGLMPRGGSEGMGDRQPDYAGGALLIGSTDVEVSSCTFVGNSSYEGTGGAIALMDASGSLTLRNGILAYNQLGGAIACLAPGAAVNISCTDIYNNYGGDWTDCIAGQAGSNGNISLEPMMCAFYDGDFTIRPESPCAPEHSGGCGLIGAWPAECGISSVASSTAGALDLRVAPNPTSGLCRISLQAPAGPALSVKITDAAGRLIRDLTHAGAPVSWDGRDSAGRTVPSGVYFVRAQTAAGAAARPVVIAR